MRKKLFFLLIILSFNVFAKTLYEPNPEFEKKVNLVIKKIRECSYILREYKEYIKANGLYDDYVFEYLSKELKKNKKMIDKFKKDNDYDNMENFLNDFKEVSKLYSYQLFKTNLGKKTIEEYELELSEIEKSYIQMKSKEKNISNDKKEEIDLQIKNINVLKKKLKDFRQLESVVKVEDLEYINKMEKELSEAYYTILR